MFLPCLNKVEDDDDDDDDDERLFLLIMLSILKLQRYKIVP